MKCSDRKPRTQISKPEIQEKPGICTMIAHTALCSRITNRKYHLFNNAPASHSRFIMLSPSFHIVSSHHDKLTLYTFLHKQQCWIHSSPPVQSINLTRIRNSAALFFSGIPNLKCWKLLFAPYSKWTGYTIMKAKDKIACKLVPWQSQRGNAFFYLPALFPHF